MTCRRSGLAVLVFLAVCPLAKAAPTVTSFFPAGGQRGTTVEVTAGGTFEKWPVTVWVSEPGVSGVAAKEKGKLSLTIAPDARPGVRWLRLFDETGASSPRPFLVGTLPEVQEKEPNDEAGTPIAGPTVVNGRLGKSGDVDSFAVKLSKRQTLVAALEAYHTLRSPMDAVLQVTSADGFVLDQSHDHAELDPLIAFTAPADGTYHVRLFAFPSTPDSSIRFAGGETYIYRLTLTTTGYADHAWPTTVFRDDPAPVELVGWNIPAAARKQTVPKGQGVHWLTPAEVANPVAVRIDPHPCFDGAALVNRKEPLAVPATISGRWEKPGPAHRYPVTFEKGKPVTLRAESESLGFLVVPSLSVTSPTGEVLARAEPGRTGGDVELSFTPKSSAPHVVEVRDLYQGSGLRHAYRLTLTHPAPDFALTVPTDRVGVAPGQTMDFVVTVVPRNGFSGAVELAVEGLPEGVKAVAVKPEGKKPANQLTLRFTAGAAFPQGPIRIIGTGQTLRRTATAALPDFGITTEDLWLQPTAAAPVLKKKKR
jgi:hypothetical protein